MIDPDEYRSYAAKMRRKQEKDEKLIKFLIEEKFIFVENLHHLYQYKSKNPHVTILRNSVKRLIKNGLVKHHMITKKLINKYFSIELYYLTDSCLEENLTEKQLAHIDDYRFVPSQIHIDQVAHRFEMQQAMIRIMNLGYKVERISFKQNEFNSKKVPDFFFYRGEERFAVEYERSVKDSQKYQEILGKTISDIKSGFWQKVLYVCPDELIKNKVKNQLKKLTNIVIDGETYEIKEDGRQKIETLFYFHTLEEINEKDFLS